MPEAKQYTRVNIGGLDAGGKNPQLVRDGLLVLENGQYLRQGAVSLRSGFQAQTGTYTDDRMGTYKDRPVVYGQGLKVFGGSTSQTVSTFKA